MFNLTRRLSMLTGVAVLCAAQTPAVLAADPYPAKVIRIIVPFSVGGPSDAITRAFAQELSPLLGQPVIVDNRVGADTMIGTRAALQAPADGYTLLLGTTSLGTTELMHKEAGFTLRNFRVVAPFGFQGFFLSTNTMEPIKSLDEFIKAAKQRPGGFNNALLAAGSPMYFLTKRFEQAAGIEFTDINYPGSAAAMNDVIAGRLQVIVNGPQTTLPLVRAGKLRALAVTTETRLDIAPEIPTFKELGYAAVTGGVWYGIVAPANVPREIIDKLTEAGARASRSEAVRRTLANVGIQPWTKPTTEFDAVAEADRQQWVNDAARLGITPR